MIVTCNECAARYRVNEDKLPPGGGNIKCPKCAHVFFVRPPGADLDALPKRPGGASAGGLDAPTAVAKAPDDIAAKFGLDRGDVPYDQKPTRPTAGSLDEADAKPKKKPGEGNWKLKTNFGLVYDFPDTNSLRNWLSARDDLSGYQLAAEGEEFANLDQHEAVLTTAIKQKIRKGAISSAAATGVAAGGSNEAPYEDSNFFPEEDEDDLAPPPAAGRSKPKPKPAPIALIAAPEQANSNRAIYLGIVFVLLVSGALALQISGVLDLRKTLFGGGDAPVPVVNTVVEPQVAPPVVEKPAGRRAAKRVKPLSVKSTAAPNPFTPRTQAKSLVAQAQQDIRARKYDDAISNLMTADRLDPGNKKIYRLLERTYSRAGKREQAREVREKMKDL
jgi:predicted Zn finger-like uncharacterized protein